MGFVNVSNEIIYAAIILGFVLPFFGPMISPYLIHIVFLMMVLSLLSVDIHGFENIRYREVASLLAINLIVFSSLLIMASILFIDNIDFRMGIIALAVVPPAIGVVPLSAINKGDINISIVTEFIAYLVCLVYTPIMLWIMFGGLIDIFEIVKILLLLIIVPFILSRAIRRINEKSKKINFKTIISVLIGLSIYTAIAISRDIIFTEWRAMLIILLLMIVLHFPIGAGIFHITKKMGIIRKERIEYVLFGTMKNGNMALSFSLMLIGPAAAVPLAISSAVFGFYVPFLSYLFEKHDVTLVQRIRNKARHILRNKPKEVKNKIRAKSTSQV